VAGAAACFAIEIDELAKAFRFTTDDGDHERQPKHSGADERSRRAAHPDPDRNGSCSGRG
jgi:hypothetical protein